MTFILDHFTMIVGTLCLVWAIFQVGRLWEREHSMLVFTDDQLSSIRRDLAEEQRRIDASMQRGIYDYTNE